jgi:2-haloacid dehalogenase
MQLTDFDALSFDCYGTLIDWETGLRSELAKIAALDAAAPSADTLLETYGACEAETERAIPGLVYPDVIARSAVATGAIHGIGVSPALAADIGASVPNWPAFADSAEALARLQRHFKLIILSNVDRASFAGSNTRLGVTFDAIVTAEDIGSYKPNPRNFEVLLATAAAMDIAQGRLLHVAQSLYHDHVPAQAAGLPTVWIDRRHAQEGFGATPPPALAVEPTWTFPSMAAFADAVAAEQRSE